MVESRMNRRGRHKAALGAAVAILACASPAPAHAEENAVPNYTLGGSAIDGIVGTLSQYPTSMQGGGLITYRYPHGCLTAENTDAEIPRAVMPTGWNDVVSSVKDSYKCDFVLFWDGGLVGARTYKDTQMSWNNVGSTWNNQTSSFWIS